MSLSLYGKRISLESIHSITQSLCVCMVIVSNQYVILKATPNQPTNQAKVNWVNRNGINFFFALSHSFSTCTWLYKKKHESTILWIANHISCEEEKKSITSNKYGSHQMMMMIQIQWQCFKFRCRSKQKQKIYL